MQDLERQMSNRESNHEGRELGCWKQCAIHVRRLVVCGLCGSVMSRTVIAALLKELSSPINDDAGDHSLPHLPHILSCGTIFRTRDRTWAPKTTHPVAGRGVAMCVDSSRLRTRCRETNRLSSIQHKWLFEVEISKQRLASLMAGAWATSVKYFGVEAR